MQLPAFKEKILQLSRTRKILYITLLIAILLLASEGFYYLWTQKISFSEKEFIDTEDFYEKGVFLYPIGGDDVPIAARGWVGKIEGWYLTLENQGEQFSVEIDDDFKFAKIDKRPTSKSGEKEKVDLSDVNFGEVMENEALEEEILARSSYVVPKGVVGESNKLDISDLSHVVKVGDFVVVSEFEYGVNGEAKGNFLSILEYLKK
jgi:hypothetical protein